MGKRVYPAEVRRRALDLLGAGRRVVDLLGAGRRVVDLSRDLGVSEQTIYTWHRQERIDRGLVPEMMSVERAELAAAKRRRSGTRSGARGSSLGDRVADRAQRPKSRFAAIAVIAGRPLDRARLPGARGIRLGLLRPAQPPAVGQGPAPHLPVRDHPPGPPRQPRHLCGPARARRAHPRSFARRRALRGRDAHDAGRDHGAVRVPGVPAHAAPRHGRRARRAPVRPR